jgi:hypothetical protein
MGLRMNSAQLRRHFRVLAKPKRYKPKKRSTLLARYRQRFLNKEERERFINDMALLCD